MNEITKAILKTLENKILPLDFNGLTLIEEVRKITGREYLYDSTITRYLRRLRKEGILDYEVIDKKKSQYKLLKVKE
jgi:hypothetical protein